MVPSLATSHDRLLEPAHAGITLELGSRPASKPVREAPRADEEVAMPGKEHLRGASDKEQRQYEHIVEDAKKEGRYKGREEEVAARTVMKQHKEEGHQPHD